MLYTYLISIIRLLQVQFPYTATVLFNRLWQFNKYKYMIRNLLLKKSKTRVSFIFCATLLIFLLKITHIKSHCVNTQSLTWFFPCCNWFLPKNAHLLSIPVFQRDWYESTFNWLVAFSSVQKFNVSITDSQTEQLVYSMDRDKNGVIDFRYVWI